MIQSNLKQQLGYCCIFEAQNKKNGHHKTLGKSKLFNIKMMIKNPKFFFYSFAPCGLLDHTWL